MENYHTIYVESSIKLDLFFFNKKGNPFLNPHQKLKSEKLSQRLNKGDQCKWFKTMTKENRVELENKIQEQLYACQLTKEEILDFLS